MLFLPTSDDPPWYKQDQESDRDFALFNAWLLWPEDSIASWVRNGDLLGAGRNAISGVAARWRWKARRKALAHHLTQIQTEVLEERAAEAGTRLAQAWEESLDWALSSILDAKAQGERLPAKEALAFLKASQDRHSLDSGQPTHRFDISALTPAKYTVEWARALAEECDNHDRDED